MKSGPVGRSARLAAAAAMAAVCLLGLPFLAAGHNTSTLVFADFNNQAPFNNFSGDSGTFADKSAALQVAFDHRVFHGAEGSSLRIDYSVPSGYCGLWFSTLGMAACPQHTLDFTNLYGRLQNSTGNPSRIENVRVTKFSFWARGDGQGSFAHRVKVELKSPQGLIASKLFNIPDKPEWMQFDFPVAALGKADLSRVKEIVFVLEGWRNAHRRGRLYLDDLTFSTDEPSSDPSGWSDEAMLDAVSQRAFSYFWRFVDSRDFALDRSTSSDVVSIGAIGFQLAAYVVGCQRHWAPRDRLEERTVKILRNLAALRMGPEPGTECGGYQGFYYHFLNAGTGLRKDAGVELSLYDTALLMYGVLSSQQYFHDNPQIQALSRELFDRVQWDWFVDHASGANSNRFHLGWMPGPTPAGTFLGHVDGQTDEALLVDVLALGSPAHPVSLQSHNNRNRFWGVYPARDQEPVMVSWQGSLFNYFFASCWLDFRKRGLDLHPNAPEDLWQNDRLAIVANRRFCVDHAAAKPDCGDGRYSTYGPDAWGLTACDNLAPPSSGLSGEYYAFGALPNEQNIRFRTQALQTGTLAVYGAVSSINFVPQEAIAALRHDFQISGLWSPLFGFGDAYSLDPHYLSGPYDDQGNPRTHFAGYLNGPWVNHMIMGVDVGPMLLAIENYRTGAIWKLTARSQVIAAGLNRIFGLGAAQPLVGPEPPGATRGISLKWNPMPGASAYNIYSSPNRQNWRLLQEDVRGFTWTDPHSGKNGPLYYQVKGIPSRDAFAQRARLRAASSGSTLLTSEPPKEAGTVEPGAQLPAERDSAPAGKSASIRQTPPAG